MIYKFGQYMVSRICAVFTAIVMTLAAVAAAEARAADSVVSWEKKDGALWVTTSGGVLFLQPHATGSLHVMYGSASGLAKSHSYAVREQPVADDFRVDERPGELVLATARLRVTVDKRTGCLRLADGRGNLLVGEDSGTGRGAVANDSVRPACRFRLDAADALYGLGQFRDGRMNLRNTRRELVQFNTQAAVPVIYSSRGWGLFWDNPSRTVFTDDDSGMSFVSDYGKIVDYKIYKFVKC